MVIRFYSATVRQRRLADLASAPAVGLHNNTQFQLSYNTTDIRN